MNTCVDSRDAWRKQRRYYRLNTVMENLTISVLKDEEKEEKRKGFPS